METVPIQLINYAETALLDVIHVQISLIAYNVQIKKFCQLINKLVVHNVILRNI